MKYDIIIAGGGLGGLACGYILSKQGYNVCILEKNADTGGCLQSFRRGKYSFDTGFHCVGGLEEGQPLYRIFKYFDLMNLPWRKMDENGFAEIVINSKSYMFASGHERFVETLSKDFPAQRKNLEKYASLLKNVGDNIYDNFGPDTPTLSEKAEKEFGVSAFQFLQQITDDNLLRNVLSGASLTMELNSEKLPLYVFAQINNSFIQSAWRLAGNGSLIAEKLAENIRKTGGTILTKAKVTRFIETDGKITSVEINGNEQFCSDYVISNIHPAVTLDLIKESKCIRKIYRTRIAALPDTFGMFTAHLKLKAGSIPYFNRNIFVYGNSDVWKSHRYEPGCADKPILITCYIPRSGNFTENIDILTPMYFEEVARWSNTAVGRRGDDYKAFKQTQAEKCIAIAEKHIAGLRQSIEHIYASTPLTYRDYTGTRNGSAYGIQKDFDNLLYTMLAPQTPVQNLFLTGQNLNLHGITGVSITAITTCAKISNRYVNI
ncbi:MAG: NAD(P)-binding protein [Prevotellaceae bacterium]|jgi:all-trans-retinol 13,14-reductase|nr:NAD(P)-binding protein [Prevotellaceae bacterium]